jgi:hypothetical protein
MLNLLFTTLLILFIAPGLFCQKIGHVGMEAGILFFVAPATPNENIRAGAGGFGYNNKDITSGFNVASAEFKIELLPSNPKWRFFTGLKYSGTQASLHPGDRFLDDNSFFFYKFREDASTTEYVTLTEVRQHSQYAGVPLEVAFFPFNPRWFNLYFKAGVDLNVKLKSDIEVDFQVPEMKYLGNQLSSDFGEPGNFHAIVGVSAGIQLGKPGRTKFQIEVPAPSFFLESNGGIVNPETGGGLIFSVFVPLNKIENE